MKAVIYARYSSYSQTEQSIEGQVRVCREYARREQIEIVGEYIDRAISGTAAETRPQFQKMISDARRGIFDSVLVYKLDRFARNRYDSAVYKHKLKLEGVRLISATENISENPEGIILEAVLEASAEYYSRELSQKVRRGLRENALKGLYGGAVVPLGYKAKDRKVYIDEAEARVVRYVFEETAKGTSPSEIVREVNKFGVTTRNGQPFIAQSFGTVLRNKKYLGICKVDGVEYSGVFPPIIDEEVFVAARRVLEERAYAPARNKATDKYLLSGKVYCGLCGELLVGDSGTSKTGATHKYYCCGNRKKHRSCKKKSEKKDWLEKYVVQSTLRFVLQPEQMNLIAARTAEEGRKAFDKSRTVAEIKALEQRIVSLDRESDKVYRLILNTEDLAAIKTYEKSFSRIETQKADIRLDIEKLKESCGVQIPKSVVLSWIKSFADGDTDDDEYRCRVINAFVNKVYVSEENIYIVYNLFDEPPAPRPTTNNGVPDELKAVLEKSNNKRKKQNTPQECSDLNSSASPNFGLSLCGVLT